MTPQLLARFCLYARRLVGAHGDQFTPAEARTVWDDIAMGQAEILRQTSVESKMAPVNVEAEPQS